MRNDIKKETYRHIESEIKGFYDTLKNINILRNEIILSSRNEEKVGYKSNVSLVERRGTKLAELRLLQEMEQIVNAIRDVYGDARDEVKKIIWIRYGLNINWSPPESLRQRVDSRGRYNLDAKQMAEILGSDESTFHRLKRGFIYAVAEKLGWY